MAATKKVTVSLPHEIADGLSAYLAREGGDGNVSAYVSAAVKEKLERDDALAQLRTFWGDLDPELLAKARASLLATPVGDPRTA